VTDHERAELIALWRDVPETEPGHGVSGTTTQEWSPLFNDSITAALSRDAIVMYLSKQRDRDGFNFTVCLWEGRDYQGNQVANVQLTESHGTYDQMAYRHANGSTLLLALIACARSVHAEAKEQA